MTRDVPEESRNGAGAALAKTSVPARPRGGCPKGRILSGEGRPRTRAGPRAEPYRGGTRRERAGRAVTCAGAPEHPGPVPHAGHGECRMGRPMAGEGGTPSRA